MRFTFRLNGVGYSGARNADFASIGTVRMIPGSVIGPPPLEAVTVTVAIPFFPSLVAVIVATPAATRSEEHTSELQSHHDLVCRLLLEKKKQTPNSTHP